MQLYFLHWVIVLWLTKWQLAAFKMRSSRYALTPLLKLKSDNTNTEIKDPLASFSFAEVLSPPRVDWRSIGILLGSQAFLLGGTSVGFNVLNIAPMSANFNPNSMMLALEVAVPMIVGGLVLDQLPNDFFKKLSRDTRIFTLRILGRGTSPLLAAIVALVISACAGFSEEYAFRGLLFTYTEHNLGVPAAFFLSSLAFGLAHFPLFGSSTFVEATLGAIFALSFYLSGYNIAVPIAVHTMYDFGTILFTWIAATADLKKRITVAEAQFSSDLNKGATLPDEFAFIARAIFGLMDVNNDGAIDEKEFVTGMKLFGMGTVPLGVDPKEAKQMFTALDTNGDGVVTFAEYQAMFRDLIRRWLTML